MLRYGGQRNPLFHEGPQEVESLSGLGSLGFRAEAWVIAGTAPRRSEAQRMSQLAAG